MSLDLVSEVKEKVDPDIDQGDALATNIPITDQIMVLLEGVEDVEVMGGEPLRLSSAYIGEKPVFSSPTALYHIVVSVYSDQPSLVERISSEIQTNEKVICESETFSFEAGTEKDREVIEVTVASFIFREKLSTEGDPDVRFAEDYDKLIVPMRKIIVTLCEKGYNAGYHYDKMQRRAYPS